MQPGTGHEWFPTVGCLTDDLKPESADVALLFDIAPPASWHHLLLTLGAPFVIEAHIQQCWPALSDALMTAPPAKGGINDSLSPPALAQAAFVERWKAMFGSSVQGRMMRERLRRLIVRHVRKQALRGLPTCVPGTSGGDPAVLTRDRDGIAVTLRLGKAGQGIQEMKMNGMSLPLHNAAALLLLWMLMNPQVKEVTYSEYQTRLSRKDFVPTAKPDASAATRLRRPLSTLKATLIGFTAPAVAAFSQRLCSRDKGDSVYIAP